MTELRPLPFRRLLAVFLASVYVVGAFGGLAHVATVEHERCPEHGEIMHASAGLERGGLGVTIFEEPRLQASARGEHHGDHDHCLVTAPATQENLVVAHKSVVLPLAHEAPSFVTALHEVPSAAGQALYLLAPKNSPPA